MSGHRLGLLERPAILQVIRDSGCPEAVTADRRENPRVLRSPLNHLQRCVSAHPLRTELLGLPNGSPEDRLVLLFPEVRSVHIRVNEFLCLVMCRHFVVLASFL